MRGCGGEARTATRAKVPLGSIAMALGRPNRALVPTAASLKPLVLPASVVVAPEVRSIRRMRWLLRSCDAPGAGTLSERRKPATHQRQWRQRASLPRSGGGGGHHISEGSGARGCAACV